MEKVPEASSPPPPPPETTVLIETTNLDLTPTPPPNQRKDEDISSTKNELRKLSTPERLKLPKALRYPERYRSPTDMMVSPITKGVLARTRRGGGGGLLPPSRGQQLKNQDISMAVQEVGLFP